MKKFYGWYRMLCVEVYWGLYPKVWSAIACELEQSNTHTASLCSLLCFSLFVCFFFLSLIWKLFCAQCEKIHWKLFPIFFRCDSFTIWKLTKTDNTEQAHQFSTNSLFLCCLILLFFFLFYSSKSYILTNKYI